MRIKWKWLRSLTGYYDLKQEYTISVRELERDLQLSDMALTQQKVSQAGLRYSARMLLTEWLKNAEFDAKRQLERGGAAPVESIQCSEHSLVTRTTSFINQLTINTRK